MSYRTENKVRKEYASLIDDRDQKIKNILYNYKTEFMKSNNIKFCVGENGSYVSIDYIDIVLENLETPKKDEDIISSSGGQKNIRNSNNKLTN